MASIFLWICFRRKRCCNNQRTGDSEPAEYVLGREYATGERLLKNLPKAVELLTRAAKKENNFAQYRLGKLFLKEPALYDVGKAIIGWNRRPGRTTRMHGMRWAHCTTSAMAFKRMRSAR